MPVTHTARLPGRSLRQEVLAVAPIFKKGQRLPFISGSATRTSLTNGSIPNFFRVVPNDSVQGPTTAKYIRQVLKAKDVFIVDDQTAYSRPLANGVQANLKAGGVKVTRNSIGQKVTDFSSLVSKIGDDQLFYLRSRGLSERQARALMLTAFARGDAYHAGDTALTQTLIYRGEEGWQFRGISAIEIDHPSTQRLKRIALAALPTHERWFVESQPGDVRPDRPPAGAGGRTAIARSAPSELTTSTSRTRPAAVPLKKSSLATVPSIWKGGITP